MTPSESDRLAAEVQAAIDANDIPRLRIAALAVCEKLRIEDDARARSLAKLSRKVARQRRIDERAYAFRKRPLTDEILNKRAD